MKGSASEVQENRIFENGEKGSKRWLVFQWKRALCKNILELERQEETVVWHKRAQSIKALFSRIYRKISLQNSAFDHPCSPVQDKLRMHILETSFQARYILDPG
nr:hypothetical protein Iba_chr11dCG6960 [Ipomoea batatas]GMD56886.1 hypothetical protein Iba_chr11eCG7450 [Ipomoea batatas]